MTTRTTDRAGVRRAAVLFCGAGLALAGLVTMIVLWVQVATAALTEGARTPDSCVTAAGDGAGDAQVTYAALPPSATCTWTVDGERTATVLAESSAPVAWTATGAAAAGLVLVAAGAVSARRARVRRDATDRSVDG